MSESNLLKTFQVSIYLKTLSLSRVYLSKNCGKILLLKRCSLGGTVTLSTPWWRVVTMSTTWQRVVTMSTVVVSLRRQLDRGLSLCRQPQGTPFHNVDTLLEGCHYVDSCSVIMSTAWQRVVIMSTTSEYPISQCRHSARGVSQCRHNQKGCATARQWVVIMSTNCWHYRWCSRLWRLRLAWPYLALPCFALLKIRS